MHDLLAMLKELHPDLSGTILDFGSGEGSKVRELRASGYNAFGADIIKPKEPSEFLRLINDGIIPFPDETFDVVFSESVFEHVMDYGPVVRETWRVLKPGGIALHVFPSRYGLPKELHIYVPCASFFRPRWWLWLWAHLGIRNEFQTGLLADRVAELNEAFLRDHTNYLTVRALRNEFGAYFPSVEFREDVLLKNHTGSAGKLWPLARRFPALLAVYRTCRMRAVVCSK